MTIRTCRCSVVALRLRVVGLDKVPAHPDRRPIRASQIVHSYREQQGPGPEPSGSRAPHGYQLAFAARNLRLRRRKLPAKEKKLHRNCSDVANPQAAATPVCRQRDEP